MVYKINFENIIDNSESFTYVFILSLLLILVIYTIIYAYNTIYYAITIKNPYKSKENISNLEQQRKAEDIGDNISNNILPTMKEGNGNDGNPIENFDIHENILPHLRNKNENENENGPKHDIQSNHKVIEHFGFQSRDCKIGEFSCSLSDIEKSLKEQYKNKIPRNESFAITQKRVKNTLKKIMDKMWIYPESEPVISFGDGNWVINDYSESNMTEKNFNDLKIFLRNANIDLINLNPTILNHFNKKMGTEFTLNDVEKCLNNLNIHSISNDDIKEFREKFVDIKLVDMIQRAGSATTTHANYYYNRNGGLNTKGIVNHIFNNRGKMPFKNLVYGDGDNTTDEISKRDAIMNGVRQSGGKTGILNNPNPKNNIWYYTQYYFMKHDNSVTQNENSNANIPQEQLVYKENNMNSYLVRHLYVLEYYKKKYNVSGACSSNGPCQTDFDTYLEVFKECNTRYKLVPTMYNGSCSNLFNIYNKCNLLENMTDDYLNIYKNAYDKLQCYIAKFKMSDVDKNEQDTNKRANNHRITLQNNITAVGQCTMTFKSLNPRDTNFENELSKYKNVDKNITESLLALYNIREDISGKMMESFDMDNVVNKSKKELSRTFYTVENGMTTQIIDTNVTNREIRQRYSGLMMGVSNIITQLVDKIKVKLNEIMTDINGNKLSSNINDKNPFFTEKYSLSIIQKVVRNEIFGSKYGYGYKSFYHAAMNDERFDTSFVRSIIEGVKNKLPVIDDFIEHLDKIVKEKISTINDNVEHFDCELKNDLIKIDQQFVIEATQTLLEFKRKLVGVMGLNTCVQGGSYSMNRCDLENSESWINDDLCTMNTCILASTQKREGTDEALLLIETSTIYFIILVSYVIYFNSMRQYIYEDLDIFRCQIFKHYSIIFNRGDVIHSSDLDETKNKYFVYHEYGKMKAKYLNSIRSLLTSFVTYEKDFYKTIIQENIEITDDIVDTLEKRYEL
jgi:hypothetical protein